MPVGTVKWFNTRKGYGFIEQESGEKDAFVHITAVERAGLSSLIEGQKLEFEMVTDGNGRPSADNLSVIE
ncbi:MAG: cold-shock protein [Rhodospirillales bacterium]|jgi:cold shock protein|nr:cold-shock protein [Rhodospirillales bacterium]